MFNGPVVGWTADGAVEREDAIFGDEVVKDRGVERCAIISLEDKRRAMT